VTAFVGDADWNQNSVRANCRRKLHSRLGTDKGFEYRFRRVRFRRSARQRAVPAEAGAACWRSLLAVGVKFNQRNNYRWLVAAGDSLGTVPLTTAGLPASINGQITTSTGSTGTAADLSASALQSIGNSMFITVPLAQQSAATATLTTAAGAICPPSTDCVNY